MSGTHLFYNGVLLRDCEMKQWRQEILRDESGTDVLYSKVTLTVESTLIGLLDRYRRVEGMLVPNGGGQVPLSTIAIPSLENETIVDRWREIQWRLQETRKDFWLAVNGVTNAVNQILVPEDDNENQSPYRIVLAATGLEAADLAKLKAEPTNNLGFLDGFSNFGDGLPSTQVERVKVIDLNNGPKPLQAVVEKVMGGQSLRVSFTIEVCRCFCAPEDTTTSGVLAGLIPPAIDAAKVAGVISNRWSLVESTDADWKTEHTIEGKLIVSDVRYKPMAMKLIVQPKLFPYAKLESRSFTTDKTGLALVYRFSIKETGPAAPPGLVSWDGTYTERSANGGKKMADLSVRVTGKVNPDLGEAPDIHRTNKSYLIAMAYRIAQSRIRWSKKQAKMDGSDPEKITLTDMVVVEHMAKPIIELRMSVLYSDVSEVEGVVSDQFGLRLKNMGASLEEVIDQYDPRWWSSPPTVTFDVDSEKEYTEDYGSYYDCYFQTPCSEWHTVPRGATPPDDISRSAITPDPDTVAEEAPPESVLTGATITVDPALRAELFDPDDPPPGVPVANSQHGWAQSQGEFAYIQADIDTRYSLVSGNIQLPLSKQRSVSLGSPGGASCTVVKLHAGLGQRVITMVATRLGKCPQVPEPVASLTTGSIVETYLDGVAVHDVPKLTKDGKSFIYSTQIKWVYALSRLPSTASSDSFRMASSPMDRTTPAQNAVRLADYFSSGVVESVS